MINYSAINLIERFSIAQRDSLVEDCIFYFHGFRIPSQLYTYLEYRREI